MWLVLTRTLGASPPSSSYLSHAPARTPLRLFVWCSGRRWAMEHCCEATQTDLGMAHDAVRTDPGWHHHILTGMLAHGFLWRLTMRVGKHSPRADGVATAPLVRGAPPLTHLHGARSPRACSVGPAGQSPGLSVAQEASCNGWSKRSQQRMSTPKIYVCSRHRCFSSHPLSGLAQGCMVPADGGVGPRDPTRPLMRGAGSRPHAPA